MSVLSTAYTGLNAFQRALDVTGNNIANATNKGYSRQSITLNQNPTQFYAGSYVGTGVKVESIMRNVDEYANYQVRTTMSAKGQFDVFYQQAVQLDKLLSQNGVSLSTSMQTFFDALGQLNNAPDSVASRNIALKQSQVLTQQFNFLQGKLDEAQANSTQQVTETVKQINVLTQDIAKMNQQLMGSPGSPALLDQRDSLLASLSHFMDVTVYEQGNGTINVGMSSGEMLVTGPDYRSLSVSTERSSSFGSKILLGSGSGQVEVSSKITSGALGGLMDYERDVLGRASQMIGQIAIGLSMTFNAQHQLGMDMNNNLGKEFFNNFNDIAAQKGRSTPENNTGDAVLAIELTDLGDTQLSDYDVYVVDATHLQITRRSDGASTVLGSSSSWPSAGIEHDGMTIKLNSGTWAVGDRFVLTPTRGAARDIKMQITDIRDIAMAAPVKTSADIENTGTGVIAFKKIENISDAAHKNALKNDTYTIQIDAADPTQYRVITNPGASSAGPYTLVPNSENIINIPASDPVYSITLSGIPAAGDEFTAGYNTDGFGDNRNGLALSQIQNTKIFTGATESVFDRYANLLADVGSQTNQAQLRGKSADILYSQAVDFQQSKSGVNLDEEAANLLKYKQAYEAAGKLMQISSQMLDIVFDMIR